MTFQAIHEMIEAYDAEVAIDPQNIHVFWRTLDMEGDHISSTRRWSGEDLIKRSV